MRIPQFCLKNSIGHHFKSLKSIYIKVAKNMDSFLKIIAFFGIELPQAVFLHDQKVKTRI